MKPHPRIRKTIKWGGAAVTVLLVVVWIGSAWWSVTWNIPQRFAVFLAEGQVGVGNWIPTASWPRLYCMRTPTIHLNLGFDSFSPLVIIRSAIPLWLPAAATAVIACAAWFLDILAGRRERRARLNLCPKCNYDRAGLGAGAVCPECGSAGVQA